MAKVTVDIRNNIISMLSNGQSIREVSKKIGISKSAVQEIRTKYVPDIPKPPPGRPRKLSVQDKRHCVRSVTSGRVPTATAATKKLKSEHKTNVNANTVRRALKEAGLKAKKKVKKPDLSAKNIKERLQFAKDHEDWTEADWERVIWSDETKINRFCSDGMSWCWMGDGSTLQDHHVQKSAKFGGGSIMIWGCMTSKGPGFMCKLGSTLDQHLYKEILMDELQKTIEYFDLDPTKVIFQQDNASCHTANSVAALLGNQSFDVLEWPAKSPDLNSIETLWAIVKRRINEFETPPLGMLELWERVETIWNEITPETCAKLIKSMPKRIKAVLRAKGGWTSF